MASKMQKIDYEEQYRVLMREPVRVVAYPLPNNPPSGDTKLPLTDDKVSDKNTGRDLSAGWR